MDIEYLKEPYLIFGHNQCSHDPRDGLTLFGPYQSISPHTNKVGVIGTEVGLDRYRNYVKLINGPFLTNSIERPSFPGFEAVFNTVWPQEPVFFKEISRKKIDTVLSNSNINERVYEAVDLYYKGIQETLNKEDVNIDIWFVVVPKELWLNCRPQSKSKEIKFLKKLVSDHAQGQQFLFDSDLSDAEYYSQVFDSKADFHDQLKSKIIDSKFITPLQIVVEPTLEFRDKYTGKEYSPKMKAHVAWTQSSTFYYKTGCLPWKLSGIRSDVCYLGLVYKRFSNTNSKKYACSAAQMFLDSGDGTVFRGNSGDYYNRSTGEFHMDSKSAKKICMEGLKDYYRRLDRYPKELFIHGRALFTKEEWNGFNEAINELNADTNIVGVSIKSTSKLKLFKSTEGCKCKYGVMRGYYHLVNDREGFLWTRGFIPYIQTSNSLEIPNPLRIKIDKGNADMKTVINDIFCLTKLNYNACLFADGLPVTLRFSDQVGDILTASKAIENYPMPFKFYI